MPNVAFFLPVQLYYSNFLIIFLPPMKWILPQHNHPCLLIYFRQRRYHFSRQLHCLIADMIRKFAPIPKWNLLPCNLNSLLFCLASGTTLKISLHLLGDSPSDIWRRLSCLHRTLLLVDHTNSSQPFLIRFPPRPFIISAAMLWTFWRW